MSTPLRVPLTSTNQTFTLALAGIRYLFTVKWCWPAQCWTMDIADINGNQILSGIPLVTGDDLLGQFGYLGLGGQFIVQTSNDPDAVPTFTNLGAEGNLYFVA